MCVHVCVSLSNIVHDPCHPWYYADKKLARVKTAPAVVEKEAMPDDAAGFRK